MDPLLEYKWVVFDILQILFMYDGFLSNLAPCLFL